jgi:hypothetical protein
MLGMPIGKLLLHGVGSVLVALFSILRVFVILFLVSLVIFLVFALLRLGDLRVSSESSRAVR